MPTSATQISSITKFFFRSNFQISKVNASENWFLGKPGPILLARIFWPELQPLEFSCHVSSREKKVNLNLPLDVDGWTRGPLCLGGRNVHQRNLLQLEDSSYFSTIDVLWGFQQILMGEINQEYTVFSFQQLV